MTINDDRAVVVGITGYPGLQNLQGTEHDAKEFYDWLMAGGGLQSINVKRLVSSGFPPSQPRAGDIESYFDSLHAEAVDARTGVAKRLGRRLYVYVAGHGAGLTFVDDPEQQDAAFLTAEASRWNASHVMVRLYALYFLNARIFDEVAVFMDCCRTPYSRLSRRLPPYIDINALNGGQRSFFAFATRWGLTARERTIEGRQRGIFTAALLKGLGPAGANAQGVITSTSLRQYLLLHMRDFLSDADREDPGIPQEPDIPPPAHDLIFGKVAPPVGTVQVTTRPDLENKEVRILGDAYKAVATWAAEASKPWKGDLPSGNYLAQATPGREAPFTIVGGKAIHVDL